MKKPQDTTVISLSADVKKELMLIHAPLFLIVVMLLFSCNDGKPKKIETEGYAQNQPYKIKTIKTGLPVIGLLAYDGVLMTEVTAPLDVFTKKDTTGKELFNVIIIGETGGAIIAEEGLKIAPDYSFQNCPKLDVLFVPSAYDMYAQVHNEKIVEFIKQQNVNTKYTVSNCAGAQLIGASGIADGKKIVTWIGGGKQLQKDYPNLIVQDESLVSYVTDGKFSSSNGNLASYISSLELLEKMTSNGHRKFVESYLYLERLQNWKK
jgi:transcriptional regulator GlxA family with amidase domain